MIEDDRIELSQKMNPEIDVDNMVEPTLEEDEPKVKPKTKTKVKKEPVPEKEQVKSIHDELDSILVTEYGLNMSDDRPPISTGVEVLDAYLGGGLISGGLVQLVGTPGTGKSALAARLLAQGQRLYPDKFMGCYVDSEESMTSDRLAQLGVVNPVLTPIGNITLEKLFNVITAMCEYKEANPELIEIPSMIVWDSVANTVTERAMGLTVDDPAKVMGLKANILAQLLPKYISRMDQFNITLIAINQIRDKIDIGPVKSKSALKFLHNKNVPGGYALLHNSSQLLVLSAGKTIDDEYGFTGGNIVTVNAVKNKFFRPNLMFDLVFSFSLGYSNFWSNYEFLKLTKRIKAGAWCTLTNCEADKFRQKDAIIFYRDKPEFKKAFDNHVKDVIALEIIEKNKQDKLPEGLDGIF